MVQSKPSPPPGDTKHMFGRFGKEVSIMIRNPDQYIPGIVGSIQNNIEEVFALSNPSGKRRRSEWRGKIDSRWFPEIISSRIQILHRHGDYIVNMDIIDKEAVPNLQISKTYTLSPRTICYADHLTGEEFFLDANSPHIKNLRGIIASVKQHIESSSQAGGQARPEKK